MRWGRAAAVAGAAALGAGAAALIAGRAVSEFSVRTGGDAPADAGGLRVHTAGDGKVELTRSVETLRPGRYALEWDTPFGPARTVIGPVLGTTPQTVVRRLVNPDGSTPSDGSAPPAGTPVRMTPRVYAGDPHSALGLPYNEVEVRGELGPMPAWHLPGARGVCVVAVHGIGADREQVLPLLPLFHRLKLPVLAVTLRNDEGAPPSPDGLAHAGDTEWRDIEAAIRLALSGTADSVLLYGWSTGATAVLQTFDRSPWRDQVRGIVLDSAVLDWRDTARRQATRRGVPGSLAALGVRAAEGRAGVDTAAIDRIALGAEIDVPLLLLHSPDDTVAPIDPVRRLAANTEEWVLFREFPWAEHEALWNADPKGYDEILRRYLTPLL